MISYRTLFCKIPLTAVSWCDVVLSVSEGIVSSGMIHANNELSPEGQVMRRESRYNSQSFTLRQTLAHSNLTEHQQKVLNRTT